MERENVQSNQTYQGFDHTGNEANVIQLRLDTTAMLDQIEAFLRGTRLTGYIEGKNGGLTPCYAPNGKPKMNDEGVQSLMSWLTLHLTSHTVQGNFNDERYETYICEYQMSLGDVVMTNLHTWKIDVYEFKTIMKGIMEFIIPYFSRTIDNKERESYGESVRSNETRTIQDKPEGGFLGILKR